MQLTDNPKKPPRRIWVIVLWLALLAALLWLAVPRQAESQTPDTENSSAPTSVQQVGPPPQKILREVDPFVLYGDELVFDVYRKGARIGEHQVQFKRDGDRITVETEFKLKIKVLFVTAYKFEYESTGVWESGALKALVANVNDNGKRRYIEAEYKDGLFHVSGPRGQALASDWVFPTTHWNPAVVDSATVLNTLNGRLAEVTILRKGIEPVETAQGVVDAEHFVYTGQLRDTEVWYDAAGRWVKMRFKAAKDTTYIEYVCRTCPPATSQEQAAAN